MTHPILDVQNHGQSIWYDNIRRGLILSGELQELVREGVLGVTSNPAIFEKAIAGSSDYDPALRALVAQGVGDAEALFERLAVEDIQLAADLLHPTWLRTGGLDGYVSLEVSPYLARDTEGTIDAGRRLHAQLGRENVMIKVPATKEGLPAIRQLIADGISVNVTLIFSVEAYAEVQEAYLAGLEDRAARGEDLAGVRSVASVFVSRIDSTLDAKIDEQLDATNDSERRGLLKGLRGKIALANATLAYDRFREGVLSTRWQKLAGQGAHPQRLLWASTGVKDPSYPPTLYVDELIGQDTVNTVPAETLELFRTQGNVGPTLHAPGRLDAAKRTLSDLESAGLSLRETTDALLEAGLQGFSDAFDALLGAVETKREQLLAGKLADQHYELGELETPVDATLDQWRTSGRMRALWRRDASV